MLINRRRIKRSDIHRQTDRQSERVRREREEGENGLYPGTNKNEMTVSSRKWMELKVIMLSETGQSNDNRDRVFSHVGLSDKRT